MSDKSVVYELLRVVREQRAQIDQLRMMIGGLMWFATHGDEEKLHEFHAVMWKLEQSKPPEPERDQQWDAYLIATQHELEQGRPQIPS